MSETRDLTAKIRQAARAVGFDLVGFTRLVPSEREKEYRAWLDRGDQAGMTWLGRNLERRFDPRRHFEGANSAVVLGLRYDPLAGDQPVEAPVAGDLWPKVARYARGRDYHKVAENKLRRLAATVGELAPTATLRWWVDHGPLLERELGARAGLGWVGKNTLLLSREEGSYFLLAQLLTDLELEADAPVTDHCGRCTRCLDACPTGALPRAYRLDARACISYWTIEHRGEIPPALRDHFEGWVFGCDICQEVCPWNMRRREPADQPELELPEHRRRLGLADLLGLQPHQFFEYFAGSAMTRPKLAGLQRNVTLAMAARRDQIYVAPLVAALVNNPDPVVRGHAAWALGTLGGGEARAALQAAAGAEESPVVRGEIAAAVAKIAAHEVTVGASLDSAAIDKD